MKKYKITYWVKDYNCGPEPPQEYMVEWEIEAENEEEAKRQIFERATIIRSTMKIEEIVER